MGDRQQDLGEKGPPAWTERGRDMPDEPPDSSGEVDQVEGHDIGGTEPDDAAEDGTHASQQRLARTDRDTGGDAEAAGSMEEREAVAQDEDDTWRGGSGDA